MEALDLRKFIWNKGDRWCIILAITDFEDKNVVVYRETEGSRIVGVLTVDQFLKEFQPTYKLT